MHLTAKTPLSAAQIATLRSWAGVYPLIAYGVHDLGWPGDMAKLQVLKEEYVDRFSSRQAAFESAIISVPPQLDTQAGPASVGWWRWRTPNPALDHEHAVAQIYANKVPTTAIPTRIGFADVESYIASTDVFLLGEQHDRADAFRVATRLVQSGVLQWVGVEYPQHAIRSRNDFRTFRKQYVRKPFDGAERMESVIGLLAACEATGTALLGLENWDYLQFRNRTSTGYHGVKVLGVRNRHAAYATPATGRGAIIYGGAHCVDPRAVTIQDWLLARDRMNGHDPRRYTLFSAIPPPVVQGVYVAAQFRLLAYANAQYLLDHPSVSDYTLYDLLYDLGVLTVTRKEIDRFI